MGWGGGGGNGQVNRYIDFEPTDLLEQWSLFIS